MFGKLFKSVTDAFSKWENEDMLKAVIGGATLVIFADGEADPSEYDSLKGIIHSHDKLKAFGADIDVNINDYKRLFIAGSTTATVKVLQELGEFDFSSEEKNEIFAVLVDIAKANGEIDESEVQILRTIGEKLYVDLSLFGF